MLSLLSGHAADIAIFRAAPRWFRYGRARALSGAAVALALLAPRAASAYDSLAAPCDDDPLFCQRGAIAFERKDALPIEFDFDTGWTPAGSPLQVHLWAAVYANTQVGLEGALEATWPDALALAAPGAVDGGTFSYHYGLDIGAQGKVSITIAGTTYEWTGDIPYVPQVDLQVQSDQEFNAWGWEPGVTMTTSTEPQRIATVSIGDIIGASIPGIDGGFELDVGLDVGARYRTTRLVINTTDGAPVSGGQITSDTEDTSDNGASSSTSTTYAGGPSIELDVHPEGQVTYDGTIHFIPAFYVSLLGNDFEIPIADIPIGFPIAETEWVFDKQRVHVPLPDLELNTTEIDFGEVEVGQESTKPYSLHNAGESALGVAMVSDAPESFTLADAMVNVEPSVTEDSGIRFAPEKNGEFKATILVSSNDPSEPLQKILVKGVGYGAAEPGNDSGANADQDGSCACRAGGPAQQGAPEAAWAAGIVIAAIAGRRLRRQRRRAT